MRRFQFYRVFFLLLLIFPLGLAVIGIKGASSSSENRKMVQSIDLKKTKPSKWTKAIEAYWNDSIPFRSLFVDSYVKAWTEAIYSQAGKDVRGSQQTYFPNWSNAPVLENYLGLHPLGYRQLRSKKYQLASHQAYSTLKGISYVAVFIPDKTTCYPELMPAYTRWKRGKSWAEQFLPYLSHTPIHLIDLTPDLLAEKAIHRIYDYHGDTVHWNGNGLAVAYKVIRNVMQKQRPDLVAQRDDLPFTIQDGSQDIEGEFLQRMVRLNDKYYAVRNDLLPEVDLSKGTQNQPWSQPDFVTNSAKTEGTILLASDSYFKSCAQNALQKSHGNIFPLIDDVHQYIHYHYRDLSEEVLDSMVETFHPDFFIEAFVERMVPDSRGGNPYLLTLADLFLQTSSAVVLASGETDPTGLATENASWTRDGDLLSFHSQGAESYIKNSITPLRKDKSSITVNEDHLAILIARIDSPVDTEAVWEVRPVNEPNANWTKRKFKMKKGINHVRIEYEAEPGTEVEWRFSPGQVAGDYKFLPIPEAQTLRQKSAHSGTGFNQEQTHHA